MASWLDDVLGPKPAPQTVSMTRAPAPQMPQSNAGMLPPGFDIASLLKKMQEDNDAMNKSGMAQYGNLMKTVNGVQGSVLGKGGLYDQASALQTNMGQTQNRAIDTAAVQGKATSDQDLISRGLGNTTIRSTAQRGIDSDATAARSAVAEQVAAAKAGLLTQRAGATQNIGNMRGDAILSKTSTPSNNSALYAQLIQQLMANGGMPGGQ